MKRTRWTNKGKLKFHELGWAEEAYYDNKHSCAQSGWHIHGAWKVIDKWNKEEEKEAGHWCLKIEKLHAVHVEFAMIARNPDRVERRGKDACERKDNPQPRGGLDRMVVHWKGIKVCNQTDPYTGRD